MASIDTIRTAVGILGNAIALGLFLSPVPTFYKIWRSGSVQQFSAVPYLATLLNCLLWVVYGLPLVHPHSTLVLTINSSGTAIEIAYVLLFLFYSRGRARLSVLFLLLAELVFVAVGALLVLTLIRTNEARSMIVGVLCVLFGTMMYAAPLSVMKLVIDTKSVEFMPFSLSLASFLNGICWTIYALLRFDIYITIPNGLGVLFAVAQLVLHAVFYKSTRRQIDEKKNRNHKVDMVEVETLPVVYQSTVATTDTICITPKNNHHQP